MYAGIVLNVLFAITGFVGLIKLGAMPVVGGGGIQNINIGYLGGFVMFMFLYVGIRFSPIDMHLPTFCRLYAALGIACELRIPIVLSRVPILGTLPGRAGYYFLYANYITKFLYQVLRVLFFDLASPCIHLVLQET